MQVDELKCANGPSCPFVPALAMSDVTEVLCRIESGDPSAAEDLLPLVYDELRSLARARMTAERPDHTLQATAIVHEAYLRLVGAKQAHTWQNRGHFFAAAAEAMRRILIDQARRRLAEKRGGRARRVDIELLADDTGASLDELLDVDEALTKLAAEDELSAKLVHLRYFAGLPMEEAAACVGIPRSSAYAQWSYARARLKTLLDGS